MDNQIFHIISDMSEALNIAQMKKLQEVLIERLCTGDAELQENDNFSYLDMFLTAKRIEGCSERTIEYSQKFVQFFLMA